MLFKFLIIAIFQILKYSCDNPYDFDIRGNAADGYYITSNIGTPPQPINLLVDTGSSNLAVTVVHLKNLKSDYFAYNDSLTFCPTNTLVKLRYVQGYWTGFLGLDVFNPCLERDCAVICNISCMSSMKDIFYDNSDYRGIIGLAYSSIALPDSSVRPFLDIFFEEKNLTNIFSLYLCGPFYSSKDQSSSCGKLHIGHYYQHLITGDIMYTPIIQEWFYEITVVDIKVDKHSIPVKCEVFNQNKSIIDSGTTNLNLPLSIYPWVVENIKDHVANFVPSNFWLNESVLCMKDNSFNTALFPSLTLTLYHSHNKFFNLDISPELYMLPVLNTSCAMLAIGISDYGVMIGSSILRGFYVIFDRENKRIGFANPRFQNIKFISEVSNLETYSGDFDQCIRKEIIQDSIFPTGLVLMLLGLLFITFCVLVPLMSWLWKFHIRRIHNVDKSDIMNLVEDE